jgi:hypothetical protein
MSDKDQSKVYKLMVNIQKLKFYQILYSIFQTFHLTVQPLHWKSISEWENNIVAHIVTCCYNKHY